MRTYEDVPYPKGGNQEQILQYYWMDNINKKWGYLIKENCPFIDQILYLLHNDNWKNYSSQQLQEMWMGFTLLSQL